MWRHALRLIKPGTADEEVAPGTLEGRLEVLLEPSANANQEELTEGIDQFAPAEWSTVCAYSVRLSGSRGAL